METSTSSKRATRSRTVRLIGTELLKLRTMRVSYGLGVLLALVAGQTTIRRDIS
ncbi:MAG TPA: hypothetical protein VH089_03340 [Streptosporangiaceae bacterium]|jgi:hypothetical protein|nr:hypothetical protein [Streptosporangiaceae bacterium]